MEVKQPDEFEGLGQLITSSYLDAEFKPLSAGHFDDFVENLNRVHKAQWESYVAWTQRKWAMWEMAGHMSRQGIDECL